MHFGKTVGVSKLDYTDLIFVDPGVKVNGVATIATSVVKFTKVVVYHIRQICTKYKK